MFKKLLIFLLAITLVIIFLGSLGHILGLGISLVILYFSSKQFLATFSLLGKLFWGIVGMIALVASVVNLPALVGILALYLLYVAYKNRKGIENDVLEQETKNDPFTNFENQWHEIKKMY